MTEPTSPADPGIEAEAEVGRTRSVHLSPTNVALVVAGGMAGTGLRYLITMAGPAWAGVPISTVGINVVGAFVLAVLLETLALRGSAWSRQVRLSVGTGLLGGFTTYSALAVDTTVLVVAHPGWAAGYALATVVLGAVASAVGIGVGRRLGSARAAA